MRFIEISLLEKENIMPFIDSKITLKLTEEKKENIKTQLGKAVSIINKPESFLMVGIEDSYDLYMAGDKLEKGAYVASLLLLLAVSVSFGLYKLFRKKFSERRNPKEATPEPMATQEEIQD